MGNRDSAAVMTTYGVSKMISDSGVMRYKIVAEEWRVFDKTQPPRQEFPKGIFLQRYDEHFNPDLFITADTAFCYNQNLWELRGRVYVRNKATGTTFRTEKLFWDMQRHSIYSDKYMHIVLRNKAKPRLRADAGRQQSVSRLDGCPPPPTGSGGRHHTPANPLTGTGSGKKSRPRRHKPASTHFSRKRKSHQEFFYIFARHNEMNKKI